MTTYSKYNLANFYGTFYTGGKIAFFSNGRKIAFASGNRISIIDLLDKKVKTLNFAMKSTIISLDIDKKGLVIVAVDSTNLMVTIDLKENFLKHKIILIDKCSQIKWSPRGKYLALILRSNIQIWKPGLSLSTNQTPFQLSRTYNGHYGEIWDIDWDQSGEFIITGGQDKIVKIFSFRKRTNFFEIQINRFKEEIFSVKFHQGYKYFLVLTKDNELTSWKLPFMKNKSELVYLKYKPDVVRISNCKLPIGKSMITATFFDFISNILLIGQTNGQIFAFDISEILSNKFNPITQLRFNGSKNMLQVDHYSNYRSPVSYISTSYNSNLIAVGKFQKGQIIVYNRMTEKILFYHGNSGNQFSCLDISPNNQLICTGNNKGVIKVWSVRSGFCLIKFCNHTRKINKIIFPNENSRIIISSSSDGTLKVFDLKRGSVIQTLFSPGLSRNFNMISIDKTNSLIASSCEQTLIICIWGLKNGSLIEKLEGHSSKICGLIFLERDFKLFSGSFDQSIRIWDLTYLVTSGVCSCDFFIIDNKILTIAIHPKKYEAAIYTETGCLYFFDFENLSSIGYSIVRSDKNFKKKNNRKLNILTGFICYSYDGANFFLNMHSNLIQIFYRSPFVQSGFILIPKVKLISKNFQIKKENYNDSIKIGKSESPSRKILDLKAPKKSDWLFVLFDFGFLRFKPYFTNIRKKTAFSDLSRNTYKNIWEKTVEWGISKKQKNLILKIIGSHFTTFPELMEFQNFISRILQLLFIDLNFALVNEENLTGSKMVFFFRIISRSMKLHISEHFISSLPRKFENLRLEFQTKIEKLNSFLFFHINS